MFPLKYFCVLLTFIISVGGQCFFEQNLQGTYLTQSIVSRGAEIGYMTIEILADSIPVWGRCHKKFGNTVILQDIAGDLECMRCFRMERRSNHVLEIHTETLSTCYINEDAALTKCPTEENIVQRTTRELMLYRIEGKESSLEPSFCPLDGRFEFTYNQNDGTEDITECLQRSSTISNCPKGNEFTINFRDCSFPDFTKKFECLGSWDGPDGQKYLALKDPTIGTPKAGQRIKAPKYRCALYKWEAASIFISFSSDSTCFNNLHSAWEGYEMMRLTPQPQVPLPAQTQVPCTFPSWSQGSWKQLDVSGNKMTFIDMAILKSYEIYCTGSNQGGLIPVHARTQWNCKDILYFLEPSTPYDEYGHVLIPPGVYPSGEELFTCMAIISRSENVLEFQMSTDFSPTYKPTICSDPALLKWPSWITQGRVGNFRKSPCPVLGEYTGMIPDAPSLCAKLSSDCNNPEIMFYTVSSCLKKTEVYEEREYRCLGQWLESGVAYTYTKRRDIDAYECFSGVVTGPDEVYIAEAGSICHRGSKPLTMGMKLTKKATCKTKYITNGIPPPIEVSPPWWPSVFSTKTNSSSEFPQTNHTTAGITKLSSNSLLFILSLYLCLFT